MERMTKRIDDGMTWFIDRDFERNGKIMLHREPCEMDTHHVGLALRRLGEYEDMEEQGLLVKIPCKVGDTIYVKIGTDAYINLDVLDFAYYRSCGFYVVCGYYNTPKCAIPLSDLGKHFFLTKEQAEQALKIVVKINE